MTKMIQMENGGIGRCTAKVSTGAVEGRSVSPQLKKMEKEEKGDCQDWLPTSLIVHR